MCAGQTPRFGWPRALAPWDAMARTPAEQPVAVFDSGVGGLTVLHELLVSLPTEDYVYLGDTARFPYGERTQAELRAFAIEIADHLLASRRQAAGGRVQRRQRGGARRARRAPCAQRARRRRDRRRRAGHPARGRRRAGRVGSVCSATPGDGRQRRLRARGRARPTRTSTSRAWRARTWRRSSRADSPFDERADRDRPRLLRAAASR